MKITICLYLFENEQDMAVITLFTKIEEDFGNIWFSRYSIGFSKILVSNLVIYSNPFRRKLTINVPVLEWPYIPL